MKDLQRVDDGWMGMLTTVFPVAPPVARRHVVAGESYLKGSGGVKRGKLGCVASGRQHGASSGGHLC